MKSHAEISQRVRAAVEARQTLGEDFFGGWQPSDIELFQRYAQRSAPTEGKITDFLGIKTSADFHPWAGHLSGTVSSDIPIPDDGLRAEAIEYFALLDSIESAPKEAFTIVELGASYGPWICALAVLARRTGRANIRLVAVEASRFLFALISRHLAENAIKYDPANVRLISGAVSTQPGILYFPKVQNAGENGGQVVGRPGDTDYVGRHVEHEAVTAYVLSDILPDGVTDLLHVDIQGHEASVLQANVSLLNERVRSIFVGLHSRKLEGELLELFHSNGWSLLRERPTRFGYRSDLASVVGWTSRDGAQYWRNPRLKQ